MNWIVIDNLELAVFIGLFQLDVCTEYRKFY